MAVPALDPALQQLRVRARSAGRVPVAVAQPVERPSLDNAVSRAAASVTGISSSVAGDPDILVVPDIQTGTMIVTALSQFVGALTPGVVLGAKVPVALTSRADPPAAHLAACAIAELLARKHVVVM